MPDMKPAMLLLGVLAALSFAPLQAQPAGADDACRGENGLRFICGLGAPPEDIAAIPGTRFLVASGLRGGGGLKLVDTEAKSARPFYTGAPGQIAPDRARFPDCQNPPEAAGLSTHGISLRRDGADRETLYVVAHGGREAIEVFEIDVAGGQPNLTWKGCVVLPGGYVANAVAAFADGTILATILTLPGTSAVDFLNGKPTGVVVSWALGEAGFHRLAGTELAGDNGIETDDAGQRFFVSATGTRQIVEFLRRDPSRPRHVMPTSGFIPDNLHWRGKALLAAGMRDDEAACGGPWRVVDGRVSLDCHRGYIAAELDPRSRRWTVVAQGPANPDFNGVATAVVMADMLWLSSFVNDRLAFRPLAP